MDTLLRDLAFTSLIFGVAAFVWFGWGQEDPPQRWRVLLGVGSGLAVVMIVVGALLVVRFWEAGTIFDGQPARQAFGIVCGIEFGAAGVGAALLGIVKRPQLIAPWILFVVGVHFVPLAIIFEDPGLHVLAALTVAGSVVAVLVPRRREISPSALTALGGGVSLLGFSARAAVLALA